MISGIPGWVRPFRLEDYLDRGVAGEYVGAWGPHRRRLAGQGKEGRLHPGRYRAGACAPRGGEEEAEVSLPPHFPRTKSGKIL